MRVGSDNALHSGLETRREAMAEGHMRRVHGLIEAVGEKEAVRLGREALFRTGLQLGKEAKVQLGVGDDRKDLIRAAMVLYRILGIEFTVVPSPQGERLEVSRCALSSFYSRETCLILSAVDEGVVSGLSTNAGMLFEQRITDGSPVCLAILSFREGME